MMSMKNGYFKNFKDDNQEIFLVHCAIHRKILLSKSIPSVFNGLLKSIVKCIHFIRANVSAY